LREGHGYVVHSSADDCLDRRFSLSRGSTSLDILLWCRFLCHSLTSYGPSMTYKETKMKQYRIVYGMFHGVFSTWHVMTWPCCGSMCASRHARFGVYDTCMACVLRHGDAHFETHSLSSLSQAIPKRWRGSLPSAFAWLRVAQADDERLGTARIRMRSLSASRVQGSKAQETKTLWMHTPCMPTA
jgi:hypothetical protein